MPRPKTKIDMGELEKLCGMQCTDEEIAAWFNVSTRTIERRRLVAKFREVMDRARAKGRVSLRRILFRQANAGNIAGAIFLSKNILGYKDYLSNEHSGPAGGPIQIASRPDFSQLTNEELEQLRTLAGKTKPRKRD